LNVFFKQSESKLPPKLIDTLAEQMIVIPSGSIQMRDDRKKNVWSVQIESFQLAKFPVTQELYELVIGSNPSTFKSLKKPVESVSWLEAVSFCNRVSELSGFEPTYSTHKEGAERNKQAKGYRLPTEAEWEYACRAGTQTPTYGVLTDIAWYSENSNGATCEVGLKQANAWGLHDMLGNVWEWTEDLYDEHVYGAYRIFRGGGWNDLERGCLASNRRRSHPTYAIDDLGFRLAKSL
jgi:formylglycine-generating enzyme required for sulfatase activity